MFHYSIDDMPRKLTLVYANSPMVKWVQLHVVLLKVTETIKMVSGNLLCLFVETGIDSGA